MRFALLNFIRNAKNPENTYACLLSRKTQISAREFYEKQLKKPEHYYEQLLARRYFYSRHKDCHVICSCKLVLLRSLAYKNQACNRNIIVGD